jgi:hypothetical protein
MIKNMIKRKINKTKRLILALSFSCFLYKNTESKINPKITETIVRKIKKNTIMPTSITAFVKKIKLSKKIAMNAIITTKILLKKCFIIFIYLLSRFKINITLNL